MEELSDGGVRSGDRSVTFNANIGDARIYGVESNIEYRPIHGLTLSLAGNYNDSVMTSNAYNNPEFVVTSGQRLPFVPYFKGSASARYEMPLDRASTPTLNSTFPIPATCGAI